MRSEDINRLNSNFDVIREKLIETNGATRYINDVINNMDEVTYKIYLNYHFSICERQDLIFASHHCLNIFKKSIMKWLKI